MINWLISIYLLFQLPSHNAAALQGGHQETQEDPIVDDEEIDTNSNDINGNFIARTYRSAELKKWRVVPDISENYGKPGERGKPVKISAEMQEIAKEKFKENQFNLVASDMILLNRSLTDVRHSE